MENNLNLSKEEINVILRSLDNRAETLATAIDTNPEINYKEAEKELAKTENVIGKLLKFIIKTSNYNQVDDDF